jgi:hypothetical protein
MNSPPVSNGPVQSGNQIAQPTLSRLIRRIHMFTGLFLAPWMLMYALSTLVMTHRDFVVSFYPSKSPPMIAERELDYSRSFPATAPREEIAVQILRDVGLEGNHYVSGGRNGKPLVVNRAHALNTRRITFDPANHKIVIQREAFRALTFLERMHRRRGYDHPYVPDDMWGFTVDVAVAAMVFWSLSGVWLWWELKPTRTWGTFSAASGFALFAIFLILL